MYEKEYALLTHEAIKYVKKFGKLATKVWTYFRVIKGVKVNVTEQNYSDMFDGLTMSLGLPNSYGDPGEEVLPKTEEEWDIIKAYHKIHSSKSYITVIDYRGETVVTDENCDDEFEEFRYSFTDDGDGIKVFRLFGKISGEPYPLYNKDETLQCVCFEFLSSSKNGKRHTEKYYVYVYGGIGEKFLEHNSVGTTLNFTAKRIPGYNPNEVCMTLFLSDDEGRPLVKHKALDTPKFNKGGNGRE